MRRAKSLRIGVHNANAVVWGPVYRTHLIIRSLGAREIIAIDDRGIIVVVVPSVINRASSPRAQRRRRGPHPHVAVERPVAHPSDEVEPGEVLRREPGPRTVRADLADGDGDARRGGQRRGDANDLPAALERGAVDRDRRRGGRGRGALDDPAVRRRHRRARVGSYETRLALSLVEFRAGTGRDGRAPRTPRRASAAERGARDGRRVKTRPTRRRARRWRRASPRPRPRRPGSAAAAEGPGDDSRGAAAAAAARATEGGPREDATTTGPTARPRARRRRRRRRTSASSTTTRTNTGITAPAEEEDAQDARHHPRRWKNAWTFDTKRAPHGRIRTRPQARATTWRTRS